MEMVCILFQTLSSRTSLRKKDSGSQLDLKLDKLLPIGRLADNMSDAFPQSLAKQDLIHNSRYWVMHDLRKRRYDNLL